jgi:hypothetical protein
MAEQVGMAELEITSIPGKAAVVVVGRTQELEALVGMVVLQAEAVEGAVEEHQSVGPVDLGV